MLTASVVTGVVSVVALQTVTEACGSAGLASVVVAAVVETIFVAE